MPEKELRKKVIGKNGLSNLLLALKIVCDLIPQILALSYFKVSWAVGFGLITFVLACIGAYVATRILKKHFEKAGVI